MVDDPNNPANPNTSSDEPPVLWYQLTSKEKRGEASGREFPPCEGSIPCLACIGPKYITLDPRSGPKSFHFNCGNKLCYLSICTDPESYSDECWKVCYRPVPCEPCTTSGGEHDHDYCCTVCGAEMPTEQAHKHQHDGQYQYRCKACNCLPGTAGGKSVQQTQTTEEDKYKEICVPEDACCLDTNHAYFGRSMIKCCLGDNICELQFWNTKKKPVTLRIVYCFDE